MYDVDPTVVTSYCYTQLQSKASGTYCVPVEPVSRRKVDEEMNSPMNILRRGAGDISLVT